jgi:(2Fe-2S) ferredoxin
VELDAVVQAVARSHQSYNGNVCAQNLAQDSSRLIKGNSSVLAWDCMPERKIIENFEELCALAPITAAPIRHHVFVCSGKSCSAAGSAEVIEAFDRELRAREILFGKEAKGKNPKGSIVLTECASVGFCAVGAAVMIYPDGVWYAQVRASDVTEIIESHLLNGLVVERLALLRLPVHPTSEEPYKKEEGDWEA